MSYWGNIQNVPCVRESSTSFDRNKKNLVLASCLIVRSYIILKNRCLSLSSSPSHGPLFLTAGGHSSNLSLWHAVNLPERDLHSLVCQEPSARRDVLLNSTYLSFLSLTFSLFFISGLSVQPWPTRL